MTGQAEAPDLSKNRLTLGQACAAAVVLLGFLLGAGGQAIYVVAAFTAAKVKSEEQQKSDDEKATRFEAALEAMRKEQADQGKVLAGMVGDMKSHGTLLDDVRERVASIEASERK